MRKLLVFLFVLILASFSVAFADHDDGMYEMYYGRINSDNVPLVVERYFHYSYFPYDSEQSVLYLNSGDRVIVRVSEYWYENNERKDVVWISTKDISPSEALGYVEYPSGEEKYIYGYIDKKYVTKIDGDSYSVFWTPIRTKLIVTNDEGANIYEKPNLNSKIINHINSGEIFKTGGNILDISNGAVQNFDNERYKEENTNNYWYKYGFDGGYIKGADVDFAEHDIELLFTTDGLVTKDILLDDGILVPQNTVVEIRIYHDKDNDSNQNEFERVYYKGKEYDDSTNQNLFDALYYNYNLEYEDGYFLTETTFYNKVDDLEVYDSVDMQNVIGYLNSGDTIPVIYKSSLYDDSKSLIVAIEFSDSYGFIGFNRENTKLELNTDYNYTDDNGYMYTCTYTYRFLSEDELIKKQNEENKNSKYVTSNNTELKNESEQVPDLVNEEPTELEPIIEKENNEVLSRPKLLSPDKKIMIACSCATFVAVIAVIVLIVINKKH